MTDPKAGRRPGPKPKPVELRSIPRSIYLSPLEWQHLDRDPNLSAAAQIRLLVAKSIKRGVK